MSLDVHLRIAKEQACCCHAIGCFTFSTAARGLLKNVLYDVSYEQDTTYNAFIASLSRLKF